ncbi:MAG: hypothetical protein Q7R32_07870 [Dehalococcoidia bacterium]|nr:hypothetical protein [Dehalococcoidia bacterium]
MARAQLAPRVGDGNGLWPVFPSNKGYGKGAFYLQMHYDQYLP